MLKYDQNVFLVGIQWFMGRIWWHTFVYLFREKPSLLFTLSSLVRPFTLGTHEAHTARGGFNKSWIHHPLFGYMIFTNMEKFCGFTVTKNSEFLRGPKKKRPKKAALTEHPTWHPSTILDLGTDYPWYTGIQPFTITKDFCFESKYEVNVNEKAPMWQCNDYTV